MPKLSRTPETVASPEPVEQSSNSLVPHRSSHIAQEERLKQMGVRPYASLLNVADLDDCDWLEHAAFDPIEAATREKVRTICLLPPYPDEEIAFAACSFFLSQYYHWASSGIEQCALLHFPVTRLSSLHSS